MLKSGILIEEVKVVNHHRRRLWDVTTRLPFSTILLWLITFFETFIKSLMEA